MPLDAIVLDIVWRVPNAPMFAIGALILVWGAATALLAFTGSEASGRPEIHFPQRPPAATDDSPAS